MPLYLNSDVGERPEALLDGSEEALIRLLDWANVACGGHAGDGGSMTEVTALCRKHRVQLGAHPSYPDREHFGREALDLEPEAIAEFVCRQVAALDAIARAQGVEVLHVKPHGALYNRAAVEPAIARAIGEGVARWKPRVILVGLAGSAALDVWQAQGFDVAPETFADRRYEPDGSLRPRRFPDALITDPVEASAQVKQAAGISTVCIHSDTPNAIAIATAIRHILGRSPLPGDVN